jgi:hypothetical protein
MCVLATAHPAKFSSAVVAATGVEAEMPDGLKRLAGAQVGLPGSAGACALLARLASASRARAAAWRRESDWSAAGSVHGAGARGGDNQGVHQEHGAGPDRLAQRVHAQALLRTHRRCWPLPRHRVRPRAASLSVAIGCAQPLARDCARDCVVGAHRSDNSLRSRFSCHTSGAVCLSCVLASRALLPLTEVLHAGCKAFTLNLSRMQASTVQCCQLLDTTVLHQAV